MNCSLCCQARCCTSRLMLLLLPLLLELTTSLRAESTR
jgi:hypothetical protein